MASLFIVIPYISDNKVVYGVYSVCISTAIFLTYADLGFISASLKFAGESYAQGDKDKEIRFFGFSTFILVTFVALIATVYLIFSLEPTLLIKDIQNSQHVSIASKLLLIQAIFSFNTVVQRYVAGVFQVRVEQYIYQKINIFASALKISSVFYFFGSGKYDIVGYFLFIKLVDFLTQCIAVFIINQRYRLSIVALIRSVRFDREIFNATKQLAFSSLFATIAWILYYELDIVVIGWLFGAREVAVFALAFTFAQFLRSLTSVILSPFQSRYNHFVGLQDMKGLKSFVKRVILFALPIFVLGIISIVVFSDSFVLSWAGVEYYDSGDILKLLVANFMFSFIVIPGSSIIVALQKIRLIYLINFTIVSVYWLGIILSKNSLGMMSFPVFKLVAGTVGFLFYLKFISEFLNENLLSFLKGSLGKIIFAFLIQIIMLLLIINYLPMTKGSTNLAVVISAAAGCSLVGLIVLYFTSNYYKRLISDNLLKILNKN